jgi:perosamine synthetase
MNIGLSRPDITDLERQAVMEVLQTSSLSLGPKLPEFEQIFARYVGRKHAAAVNSGTSALHLCIRAYGIGPGDEVITSPFTFIASANCVRFEGAKTVFADVDPNTWNIDPARLAAAVTPRTKAIVPVDVFGQPADMDPIREVAKRHGLKVIEDSCEALGAEYKGRKAGTLGDVGVFGFYPNKQVTTGEGGMIVTDDADVHRLAVSMRNQGRGDDGGWLAHVRLGYNFRLSEINCALGIAQMKRIDEILANRLRSAGYYDERLRGERRVRFQKVHPSCKTSPFVMCVRLEDDYTREDRDRILEQLREKGIGCNNYFTPVHLQPFYAEDYGHRRGDFPVCEALSDRTIALPFHGQITEAEVDRVCEVFLKLL